MLYQDVIELFKDNILPVVIEKYHLSGYTVEPINSHEGGRNVVYVCDKEGDESYILRVSYQNDRSREDYLAELEYIRYLYEHGASVSNVIVSKDGNLLEEVRYGNQTLYLCLFEKAKGMQLAENNYRYREGAPLTEYFFNCGKTLGKIHQLSKEYQPVHKRIHFSDKYNMAYIDRLLPEHLSEVKDKIADILATLDKIGKTKDNYGMVHFDYSDGNYHIDFDNGQITVYDFDNSCHAWYMYDLAELWVHGEGWIMFEPDELKRKQFMEDYFAEIVKGYRTETTIEEEMVKKLPLFVMATRIELLVDAFEVERATGENYLDEEDIEEISQCLLEGKIL
jgi:Ser/Thr protein kinase RdoA (MazF antagonist)